MEELLAIILSSLVGGGVLTGGGVFVRDRRRRSNGNSNPGTDHQILTEILATLKAQDESRLKAIEVLGDNLAALTIQVSSGRLDVAKLEGIIIGQASR